MPVLGKRTKINSQINSGKNHSYYKLRLCVSSSYKFNNFNVFFDVFLFILRHISRFKRFKK